MLKSFAGFGAAALIALGVALGVSPASAQSVMKQCGDQWQAAKAAGTTNGETWPQFLSQCRAQLKTGAVAPAPAAAPAPSMQTVPTPPVTQSPTYGQAPAAGAIKTASQCDAEYAANKAAIKASGQTKRAFVAACRAGKRSRKGPQRLRRPLLRRPRHRTRDRYSRGSSPPRLRRRQLALLPAPGSSQPSNRRNTAAPRTRSCGSTRSRASTISQARTTTGPRSMARTCARRTRRPPATAPQ